MDASQLTDGQVDAFAGVESPVNPSLSTSKPDDPCHDYDRDVQFVPYGWNDDEQGHYTERDQIWVPAI